MEFREKITIVSVGKPYSIPNEQTKELLEGCTIYYVMTANIGEKKLDDNGTLGYIPVKQSMPKEFYEEAKQYGIPAICEGTFVMRAKGNQNVMVLDKVDFNVKGK